MTNGRTVRNESRSIAADARQTRDFSDAEAECLRDLLAYDEAFAQLVTAQQAAVLVDVDEHDSVDEGTATLARDGAQAQGDAIDRVVEERIEDAQAIVTFADDAGEAITWSVASTLYRHGFTSVDDVRAASQQDLITEGGVGPSLAARIKADFDDGQEVSADA